MHRQLRAGESWRRIEETRFGSHIGNVNRRFRTHQATNGCVGSGTTQFALQFLDNGGLYAVHRDCPSFFSLTERQHAILSPTDTHRVSQHRVEHGLKLAGRAGDHLQDLGAGRLLLIEQPHVLDGDHRLIGEGLSQFDLLLTEGPRFCAYYAEEANNNSLAQKRHAEASSHADKIWFFRVAEFRIRKHIWNVNRAAVDNRATKKCSAIRLQRIAFKMIPLLLRKAVGCGYRVDVTYPSANNSLIRLAKSDSRLCQRIEHCLQIEGRAADDLEYIGGGGLLLQ